MTAAIRLAITSVLLCTLSACAIDPERPVSQVASAPELEIAPKFVATPVQQESTPVQRRCDFSVIVPVDSSFVRGNALAAGARAALTRDVVTRLSTCRLVEVVNVTGYADRMGSVQANQTLSERRAEVVKTFLVQQGVTAQRINAIGAGARDPVSAGCTDDSPRITLMRCLAADRRVTIDVLGLAR